MNWALVSFFFELSCVREKKTPWYVERVWQAIDTRDVLEIMAEVRLGYRVGERGRSDDHR